MLAVTKLKLTCFSKPVHLTRLETRLKQAKQTLKRLDFLAVTQRLKKKKRNHLFEFFLRNNINRKKRVFIEQGRFKSLSSLKVLKKKHILHFNGVHFGMLVFVVFNCCQSMKKIHPEFILISFSVTVCQLLPNVNRCLDFKCW